MLLVPWSHSFSDDYCLTGRFAIFEHKNPSIAVFLTIEIRKYKLMKEFEAQNQGKVPLHWRRT